jgi:hypothetical protein
MDWRGTGKRRQVKVRCWDGFRRRVAPACRVAVSCLRGMRGWDARLCVGGIIIIITIIIISCMGCGINLEGRGRDGQCSPDRQRQDALHAMPSFLPVQIRPCMWVCLFMHERCDGRAAGRSMPSCSSATCHFVDFGAVTCWALTLCWKRAGRSVSGGRLWVGASGEKEPPPFRLDQALRSLPLPCRASERIGPAAACHVSSRSICGAEAGLPTR